MIRRRILVERYADCFDFRSGGGIEVAQFNLARALARRGIDTEWYTLRDRLDARALAHCVMAKSYQALLPLVESDLFRSPALLCGLASRVVRVWHDVSALAAKCAEIRPCPVHGGAAPDGQCSAEAVCSDACAADIFFYDETWTHCFPRRRYIPWAVDHLPRADHHSSDGPLILLAGKAPLEEVRRAAAAARDAGTRVRLIFSNWTRLGREAKQFFLGEGRCEVDEVIEFYDLTRDHVAVFGGASAAMVLSRYRETFNFLAAEAVHFGVPVIAPESAGATRRFAAHLLQSESAGIAFLREGGHRKLLPLPRPNWGWADVAAHYAQLFEIMDRPAPCESENRLLGEMYDGIGDQGGLPSARQRLAELAAKRSTNSAQP